MTSKKKIKIVSEVDRWPNSHPGECVCIECETARKGKYCESKFTNPKGQNKSIKQRPRLGATLAGEVNRPSIAITTYKDKRKTLGILLSYGF